MKQFASVISDPPADRNTPSTERTQSGRAALTPAGIEETSAAHTRPGPAESPDDPRTRNDDIEWRAPSPAGSLSMRTESSPGPPGVPGQGRRESRHSGRPRKPRAR